MDIVIVALHFIFTFAVCRLEAKIYKSYVTPFTILAVPHFFIFLIAYLCSGFLGFIPLEANSLILWTWSLLLFWLGSLPVFILKIIGGGSLNINRSHQNNEKQVARILLTIFYTTVPIAIYLAISRTSDVGGFSAIGNERFETDYTHGPFGHLLVFYILTFMSLIGVANNESIYRIQKISCGNPMATLKRTIVGAKFYYKSVIYIALIIIFILLIIRQVKYWVILPLIAGIIYRLLIGAMVFRLKSTLLFISGIVFVFGAAYIIGFSSGGGSGVVSDLEVYKWLAQHFLTYLLGGVVTMGEMWRIGVDDIDLNPYSVFAPFVSIFNLLFGNEIGPERTYRGYVNSVTIDGDDNTNVYTIFGLVYFALGPFYSALYAFMLGFISYLFQWVAISSKNTWLLLMFSFHMSMLFLGWFGSYFTLLISLEIPVLFIMFAVVFRLGKR